MKRLIAALLLILLFPCAVRASELNREQTLAVKQIQTSLAVVKDLSEHRIITEQEAANANAFYCQQATNIIGRSTTPLQVSALAAGIDKQQGFGAFLNVVIVLAGVALLLALIGLALYYLRDVLKSLPAQFYEGIAWVFTAGLLVSGLCRPFDLWIVKISPLWLVVPGALAFSACVYLSYWLHWLQPRNKRRKEGEPTEERRGFYAGPGLIEFPTVLAGLCTVVWGAAAIYYHALLPNAGEPRFLAFIAVMAFQSFLGFSIITLPGLTAIGWLKDKQVPKSTLASLILLLVYVSVKLSGSHVPESVRLFETGSLFMGAFVYYLGLLVMSNKWYHREFSRGKYLLVQAITIVSGMAAFYLGSTFHLGALVGIGGTFFTLYLLEKYYEIPWKGVGWSWSLLGVAVALYFFVGFAGGNPQYFVWGIR